MRTALETTQVRRGNPAQPVPLAGMVALDAVGLLLADEQPPLRDQLGVGPPAVGAVEADTPALQSMEQPLANGLVTTAQLPVDDPSGSTIPSLPHPELVGLFLASATSRPARPRRPGPPARVSGGRLRRSARSKPAPRASTRRAAWRCGSSTARSGTAAPPRP